MKYQAFTSFTAQGANVQTLMSMYATLDDAPDTAVRVIPIVVFIAFSIESYLNSIGARCIPFWDEIERLPWKNKVNILHKSAGLAADWGAQHLQFAASVFKLRDKLAHGKPERVVSPSFDSAEEALRLLAPDALRPVWYSQLNKAWAYKAKLEFTDLMQQLAKMHGLHESDHLLSASSGVIQDDEFD